MDVGAIVEAYFGWWGTSLIVKYGILPVTFIGVGTLMGALTHDDGSPGITLLTVVAAAVVTGLTYMLGALVLPAGLAFGFLWLVGKGFEKAGSALDEWLMGKGYKASTPRPTPKRKKQNNHRPPWGTNSWPPSPTRDPNIGEWKPPEPNRD